MIRRAWTPVETKESALLRHSDPGSTGPRFPAHLDVTRRFAGPVADEQAILCRPSTPSASVAEQAESTYRRLAGRLAEHGSSFKDIVRETLHLRDIRSDVQAVLQARARVLGELGQEAGGPLPGLIQQAPLVTEAALELVTHAVVPRDRAAWSVRDVKGEISCACEGCARAGVRVVHLGDQVSVYSGNIYGAGVDAYEQTWNMFRAADQMLRQCGMGFGDVVRVWIYMRDIDRDYAALNKARREFFQQLDIRLRPASTGVQGGPFPSAHDICMSFEAVKSPRGIDVARMSTPLLNEAWSYGADFSRGLRVTEANKVALHISGTASLDKTGRSIHAGDFEAQAERMIDNIQSLLAQQGAVIGDMVSGVAYVKHPRHAPLLRAIFHRRGFEGFACALVEAPLCRPELLCETEIVAWLPRAASGV